MANDYNQRQNSNLPEPKSGKGPSPMSGPKPDLSMPMRTAKWPGLPGKAGPDRAAGCPEEKVYAYAQGLRGGKDDDPGESKGS